MVLSGQLALTATAQRLSNMLGGASSGDAVDPKQDLPCLLILIQATGADAYIGDDNATTSTNYGTKIVSTATVAERLGPFGTGGAVKLSDIWIAGSGATARVTAITF